MISSNLPLAVQDSGNRLESGLCQVAGTGSRTDFKMTRAWLRNPALRLGSIVGLLGGLSLVAVPVLGFRGPAIYVPYTVLVLAAAAFITERTTREARLQALRVAQ